MEGLIIYSLSLWFGFFLANYADLTRPYASFVKEALGPKWGYPFGCAFCWAFWITFVAYLFGATPIAYVFAAPVVHLFIDLGSSKLSEPTGFVVTTHSDSETRS